MPKSFFQPVVKLTQAQVDAGDGDSLSGVRIAIIDTNSQPTGKIYESGPSGQTPTEAVTGDNINTVMQSAGGGYPKVQVQGANIALTYAAHNAKTVHVEFATPPAVSSLAALVAASWKSGTTFLDSMFYIQNHSGADIVFSVPVGANDFTGMAELGNQDVGAGFTIPDTTEALIKINSDGWVQVSISSQMVTQTEMDAHTGDVLNPHGVTAAQVGLGNVENLASIQRDTGLWIPAMMTSAIDLDFESLPDGAVSTIVNTGSLGGSAGQATAAQRPIVAVDTSGRKGADFDGSNDWLESSAAWQLGATGYGIFAVFRYDGGKGYLIAEEYNADDVLYTLGLDAANSLYVGHFNGAWRKSNTAAITTGDLVVAIGNYDGANFNIRTFGADSLLAQTSSPDGLTTLKTRIGRRWDGAVGAVDSHFNGRIFRLLVKDGAFTADEINSLEAWAVRHFGLETKVVRPVNHTHPTATSSVTGLMSSTAMSKLDGVASGAEVNIQPDWNQATITADDFIKNKPTVAALEGTTVPVVDGTAAVGNATTASRSNHVHPTDTSRAGTSVATTSANGLMSSADKTKLDGVATSAAAVATTGTPAMDGTGTLGTAATSAHSDHIHPTDTSREATASKGVANGYAGLGADARVPFAQLPESVGIGFRLWTPADLGTTRAIDLDFEAATLGALASIVNQGNLGGTADQSVVGEQPMVDTIDATGRRGCLFDGTNDSLRSSAIWSLGTTYGLFAVYRRAATGAGMLISTEYPTNVAYAAGQVQDAVNNGSGGNMVFIGHFNGAWRSAAVNSVLASALGIFCGNFDGTNLNARLFGTDSLVAQTSLSGIPTGNTRIGRRWDTAGNNYFSGRVFRVIGKAGAWTTGEMQLLEGWAAHRMGASANLPSAHPYRNSPPIVAL